MAEGLMMLNEDSSEFSTTTGSDRAAPLPSRRPATIAVAPIGRPKSRASRTRRGINARWAAVTLEFTKFPRASACVDINKHCRLPWLPPDLRQIVTNVSPQAVRWLAAQRPPAQAFECAPNPGLGPPDRELP